MNDDPERDHLTGLDLFRLVVATFVLLTWAGVVVYSAAHNRSVDFGIHAVCLVATGYLFASPVGKALRTVLKTNGNGGTP